MKTVKIVMQSFVVVLVSLALISWGSVGHSTISKKSALSFPATMVGFSVWADSLSLHASDADNRKSSDANESPKHFIDIDNYAEFISKGRIASTYDSVVSLHGATFVVNNGTLPWATRNTYDSLTLAFKQLKWSKAMLIASDLGHYVADGHMPLHISANYNGQKTGQTGVHSRYESDLVYANIANLNSYYGWSVGKVTNVNQYIFSYIYKNQKYVDSVLAADLYAKQLDSSYGTVYSNALWSKTKFTATLFKNASHALAELIYSAWVEAGSPGFGSKGSVGASLVTDDCGLNFYPNPVRDVLRLKGNWIASAQLYSMDGILVASSTEKEIRVDRCVPGIYLLQLRTINDEAKTFKVVVEK